MVLSGCDDSGEVMLCGCGDSAILYSGSACVRLEM